MRLLTQKERVQRFQEGVRRLAEVLNVTEEEAVDFVEALPYSVIPEPEDGLIVIEWLKAHGWVRAAYPECYRAPGGTP